MSAEMNDRAAGAVLGTAAGDALGAGYEFGPALPDDAEVGMIGGGAFRWEPGEWTDDTSMAVPLLEVAARGQRFEGEALEHVAARWLDWSSTAKDVGNQTRAVFRAARAQGTAEAVREAAADFARTHERSAGNGSLMRTAPVALAHLDDELGLVDAARRISDLTHADPLAGDACVLWCLAIRRAIVTGGLDLQAGLSALPAERQQQWDTRIAEAEQKQPRDFPANGWAGGALQAAWSAITHGTSWVDVLERAVRGGNDTDTVAAIAGGLAGAAYGASAVPARWRRILHGWPGLDADQLIRMAVLAAQGGRDDAKGWPSAERFPANGWRTLVRHPHDDGVWLGSLQALDDLPPEIDAVVSMCRVGTRQMGAAQTDREQVEFWLIDQDGRNPNLDFVLRDAADTVAALRAEGRTVLVHCYAGQSRTPAVGAAYSVLHRGKPADVALREVDGALPSGGAAPYFRDAVRRLAATAGER
ncbi:ADP-ribosylglycohydrolase family protein [Amnibacterium soli]|uniref:ADP-ribosylglycohydrolase family protein n=1 Tax=Amnibacterium soli TaxID=1282736 RepID=A0ABP8YXE2_9MICO